MLGHILGWIIAGLIVGAIARFLVPGKQDIGILFTILLGIAGALVGGFIGTLLFGPHLTTDPTGTYAVETAWQGWIMSIIGGVIVLWVVMAISGFGRTNRLP